MPHYIVIRKPIKAGLFPEDTKNPTQQELLKDIKAYKNVYLLNSLDEANTLAELFFHAPNVPKVGGFYGLVAEVTTNFTNIPEATQVDDSAIFNNWVDSQTLGYTKKEVSGTSYHCVVVTPNRIASITNSHIPQSAKAFNSNLQDTDFTTASSSCSLM